MSETEAKSGNRKFYEHGGESLSIADWGKKFGVSRERARVVIRDHGIAEAVRRLGRSDEGKAEDQKKSVLKRTKDGRASRLGTMRGNWKLIGYAGDKHKLKCVGCGETRVTCQNQTPRCWKCKPKGTPR